MSRLDTLIATFDFEAKFDEDGKLLAVVIDGEEVPAINGEITQTILSVAIRLEEREKEFKKAKDVVYEGILKALDAGLPIRDGARTVEVQSVERKNPPYKDLVHELMTDLGRSKDEIEEFCLSRAKVSISRKPKIKAVK